MDTIVVLRKDKKPVTYAKAKQVDPTQTTALRNAFVRDMKGRFLQLAKAMRIAIDEQDCFGLKTDNIMSMAEGINPGNRAFAFPRSADKVNAFNKWLEKQNEIFLKSRGKTKGIELIEGSQLGSGVESSWTNKYIHSAYQKGISRARGEMKKVGYDVPSIERTGGIGMSMNMPMHIDRIGLAYSRTYEELKGITTTMSTQVSRVLAQGLADGKGPKQLAYLLVKTVTGRGGRGLGITDTLGRYIPAMRRAEIMARTETIRAHHIATIQEYKNWGLADVQVQAEWTTAGDDRVCDECAALEGKIFTIEEIESMIPLHPQCRCIALPIEQKELDERAEAAKEEREEVREKERAERDILLEEARKEEKEFAEMANAAAQRELDEKREEEKAAEAEQLRLEKEDAKESGLSKEVEEKLALGQIELTNSDKFQIFAYDKNTGERIDITGLDLTDPSRFTKEEKEMFQGQIIMHNMPKINIPYSDLELAGYLNPSEIRVVFNKDKENIVTFSIRPTEGSFYMDLRDAASVGQEIYEVNQRLRGPDLFGGSKEEIEIYERYINGAISKDRFLQYATFYSWNEVGQELGFNVVQIDGQFIEFKSKIEQKEVTISYAPIGTTAVLDINRLVANSGVNETYFVDFEDGNRGVFKPETGEELWIVDRVGGSLYSREVAASELDKVLGFGVVPDTVLWKHEGKTGSLQTFVKGAVHLRELNGSDTHKAFRSETYHTMKVLDFLIENRDRHDMNWMISKADSGKITISAIDNGFAFFNTKKQFANDVIGNIKHLDILNLLEKMPSRAREKLLTTPEKDIRKALAKSTLDSKAIDKTLERILILREMVEKSYKMK